MNETGVTGAAALLALLDGRSDFASVADKDWTAAAGLIVKRLLVSAGQTKESLTSLRTAVGEDLFEAQLKSLTHHQAKQLARRLDKAVPDLEVSTAGAAVAHVRTLLAAPADEADTVDPATEETESEPETTETAPESEQAEADTETKPDTPSAEPSSDETSPDDPPPANAYFGRKSFRTG